MKMANDNDTFVQNEIVLCKQGPTYWEAKIMQVFPDEESLKKKKVKSFPPELVFPVYHVHYQNWNSRWDEYVSVGRILKNNEENRLKKKELDEILEQQASQSGKKKKGGRGSSVTTPSTHKGGKDGCSSRGSTPSLEAKYKSSRTSTASDSISTPSTSRKRARPESHVETKKEFESRPEVQVKLPEVLKRILVDDWDYICNQYKLVSLPAKVTVKDIVDDFIESKRSAKPGTNANIKMSQLEQSASGVCEYFDIMLGNQLLYKFERPQYTDYYEASSSATSNKPSEYYGFVHLLRLFVRIGTNLAYTRWDEKSVQLLVSHIQALIDHIHKNYEKWYGPGIYETATPHYQKEAWS